MRLWMAEGVGLEPTSPFGQRFSSLKVAFSALSRYVLKSVRDLGKRCPRLDTRRSPKTPIFERHTAKYGQKSGAKRPQFNFGTGQARGHFERSRSRTAFMQSAPFSGRRSGSESIPVDHEAGSHECPDCSITRLFVCST